MPHVLLPQSPSPSRSPVKSVGHLIPARLRDEEAEAPAGAQARLTRGTAATGRMLVGMVLFPQVRSSWGVRHPHRTGGRDARIGPRGVKRTRWCGQVASTRPHPPTQPAPSAGAGPCCPSPPLAPWGAGSSALELPSRCSRAFRERERHPPVPSRQVWPAAGTPGAGSALEPGSPAV